ncbi:unnamed protein product [Microthlaspi erraticum]|uniref:SWIM-type domain-containing protein n=1 Tax=Microthlaspi erraticum TaxID=1685480 RepID=A0A6D2JD50_9BRAS|nr:unnamed protein product [Microthlaspi erraticum]
MNKVAHYGVGFGAATLYVVREDDPYIGRRTGWNTSLEDDENLWLENPDDGNVGEHGDDSRDGNSSDEAGNFTEDESSCDGRRTNVDDKSYKRFEIGQEYMTIDSFKSALHKYAVKKRRDIKYKKSEKSRVIAICSNGKCPWRICATINSSSPRVVVRLNPNFSAQQLQEKLLARNINVPWSKCERSRLDCLRKFDREQDEQFSRLFDYVYELKKANPGSTVELVVKGTEFEKFYVCFGALKTGWKAAFEKENTPNWRWFLEHLASDLGLETGNGLTLASDQQKGLIAAVKELLPFAEHRMCARHVYANWKKRHSGADLEDLFWSAADSYYPLDFERKMQALKDYDAVAHADLRISLWCPWSRAFFTEYSKCDAVENNLGESFNAIRIARTKPIVEMLEEIRRRVVVSNDKKRLEAEKAKGVYTPRAVALLDQQIELAKDCRPLGFGLGKYEVTYVKNEVHDRFVVHLRNKTSCSCRLFVVSGIPCCHIASALRLERGEEQDPKTRISQWFTADKLRACYCTPLGPVNGMNLWKVTTGLRVTRPPFGSPGGRPPGKNRTREKGEKKKEPENGKMPKLGITMHCGNCREAGHNKTKCTNTPKPKPPKKPPGRPRTREIPDAPGWTAGHRESTQLLLDNEWRPWNEDGAGNSSQPNKPSGKGRKKQKVSLSQPIPEVPSLSSAVPKRKRGRPRKNEAENLPYSKPELTSRSKERAYDTGPRLIPQEGYGVFTSPDTGDDYIQLGKSVVDARNNTILPSSLYKARDAKKAKTNAKKAKNSGAGFAENWLSHSQP